MISSNEQNQTVPLKENKDIQEKEQSDHVDHILYLTYRHVKESPNHILFRWLNKNGKETDTISYKQLWERSQAIAYTLQQHGINKGDRVMIAYPVGFEFLPALFGCMLVGAVGCIVHPPNPKDREDMEAFNKAVIDAGVKHALTSSNFKLMMKLHSLFLPDVSEKIWITTDKIQPKNNPDDMLNEIASKSILDVAYMQYGVRTKCGSTRFRKGGIEITQKTLIINASRSAVMCPTLLSDDPAVREKFVFFSWMPQYHDFGLLGFFMATIYSGSTGVCCSPLDFNSDPVFWQGMVIKHNANIILGSNFSYALLVKSLQTSRCPIQRWKSVELALCAAEPSDRHFVMDLVQSIVGAKACKLWIGSCWKISLTTTSRSTRSKSPKRDFTRQQQQHSSQRSRSKSPMQAFVEKTLSLPTLRTLVSE